MRTVKEEQLQKDVKVWKSRAEAHEENYLQMLKRIDDVIAERDEAVRSCHIWQKGHGVIVAERNAAIAERDRLITAIEIHRAKAFPLTGEDFDQELWGEIETTTN